MQFWSESWTNGDRIPQRFAAGRPDGAGGALIGEDLSPHLAWNQVPAAARSMVLICHDFDVPAERQGGLRAGREIPADLPRSDFFHWVLIDLPPVATLIEEGQFSRGFVVRGKPGPASQGGVRQGLNDFTGWFADDPERAGRYFGYDGPFPPPQDSLVHHYVFTLYAVALPRLPVVGDFSGAEVRAALAGRVLAEATFSGTYTLNQRLLAAEI